jgi:DNA-binding NarL/FixJ family response regulator
VIHAFRGRPRLAGLRSPRVDGALYHPGVATRVLVVEPNRLVREGIAVELARNGAEILDETATGAEALAAARQQRPDVVLLALDLPDASATTICQSLHKQRPSMPIIVLAQQGEETSVSEAIESGARGYLLKDADDLDLPDAIERVLAGERVIDPKAAAALIDSQSASGDPGLSRQELKVLRLVAEGLTNPEIGKRLYLSRHTVKEYLSHAMRKLEVANRIEAVRKATELGLLGGPPKTTTPAASEDQSLLYNQSGEPARSSDLKVTPLKIEQLRTIRKPQ